MGKIRALLVEDDLVTTEMVTKILEMIEIELVGACSTGEAALEMASKLNPDFILMDIGLEGQLDGIETAKRIRESVDTAVIYITQRFDDPTMERACKSNHDYYIIKPITEDKLGVGIKMGLLRYKGFKKEQARLLKLGEERKMLTIQNEKQKQNIEELTSTTEHLVTATWRERKAKDDLKKALDELEETKQLLLQQNVKIADSINYAFKIQSSIIPTIEQIKDHFPNSFMLYRAKDVVSGDFPWIVSTNDCIYIAVVDCTGHGVPGALMSLVGYFLLNEIVNFKNISTPSEILERLNKGVAKTLKQSRDGMDISLCKIDMTKKEIQYAGANRPLYHVRNGELEQFKGDRMAIGGHQFDENKFTNHQLNYQNDDLICIFTDGYPDQFGGSDDFKIGSKRIKTLLTENSSLSIDSIHDKFQQFFIEWMGDRSQIDDVLMIGIKF